MKDSISLKSFYIFHIKCCLLFWKLSLKVFICWWAHFYTIFHAEKKNIVAKDENNNTSDAKEKDDDDSGDQNPQATDQLPTENNGNRLEVSGSDKEKKNKNQNQEGAAGSCASGQADASRIPNTRRVNISSNNLIFWLAMQ